MLVEIHIVLLQSQTSKFCGKHLFFKQPKKNKKQKHHPSFGPALVILVPKFGSSLLADVGIKILTRSPPRWGRWPSAPQKVVVNLDICWTSAGHLSTVSCLAMGQNPIVHHKTAGTCGCSSQIISPYVNK